MFKRLSGISGEVADPVSARPEDTAARIVRSAILVHSGPGGDEASLSSSDGEICFNADRIRNVVESHNLMISKLALAYGGVDKMPVGAYPPILDQHADDSNDRIRGRLTGLLKFETRSVPKVGDKVACAVADITFLGEDTVAKVLDGRIYHLSVGIDENTDTLGEVSTVIEPAAPGAMVMAMKKKRLSMGTRYKDANITIYNRGKGFTADIEWVDSSGKDSGQGADQDGFKSEVEAMNWAKKIVDNPPKDWVDKSLLSKGKKQMSKKKVTLTKLKKMQTELKTLSAKAGEARELVHLAARKKAVSSRFTKLMADKKMTPAEFKKIDVKKLAKMDSASFDMMMDVYDSREAQIVTGQRGSTSASTFMDVATTEDREVKRLKAQAKKNLSKLGVKFKASDDEEEADKKELSSDDKKDDDKKELEADDSSSVADVAADDQAQAQELSDVKQELEEQASVIGRLASMVDAIVEEMQSDDQGDEKEEESEDKKDDDATGEADGKDSDDEKDEDKKEHEGAE